MKKLILSLMTLTSLSSIAAIDGIYEMQAAEGFSADTCVANLIGMHSGAKNLRLMERHGEVVFHFNRNEIRPIDGRELGKNPYACEEYTCKVFTKVKAEDSAAEKFVKKHKIRKAGILMKYETTLERTDATTLKLTIASKGALGGKVQTKTCLLKIK